MDEAVCYKPRRLDCRKKGEPMSVEIANVKNTSKGKAYTDEVILICHIEIAMSENIVTI